jgi:hypothetical protein
MAGYIDKNATVGILEAMSRNADCECIKKRLEKAAKRVSTMPDADVVEVVRCKDCKWDRPDTLLDKHWCSRLLGCMEVRADDFCSYGERKDCGDAEG